MLKRPIVWAWATYDFANSAFTTLVVTFVYSTYFTQAIAPDEITGTVLWSRGVTISALLVAILSPVLGALADQGGYRKRFMFLMTVIAVAGSVMLYFPEPGEVMRALFWFVIANVAFEMGIVFYNSYLPDIAAVGEIGKVSGFGWGLGYVGGLLALVLAMVGFVSPDVAWFGFSHEAGANIRATNLLVAAWFGLFSIPPLLMLKDPLRPARQPLTQTIKATLRQLQTTLRSLRSYRQVARLLLARMIYNDGLITIFAFGGIYAAGTFGFTFNEIMIFGIVINIGAGVGAFIAGPIDDQRGAKWTILVSIIGLIIATLLALLATSKAMFWVAAIMVGLLSGPNQAASRSLMARFTPAHLKNEFFGFYAFSGKATAFLGPLLLGILTAMFQSQRAGIGIVAVLFAIGGWLLLGVDEAEGIQASGNA